MAIKSNVEGFLQKVASGVRPNMFEVEINFPDDVNPDKGLTNILCKSAALPALRSIITCCSKLSDPPYSKVAPVAFSNIAPTSLIISCSGDNHGPNITTF